MIKALARTLALEEASETANLFKKTSWHKRLACVNRAMNKSHI